MIIHQFDKTAGFYSFTETGLCTGFHAHPALEVIQAMDGKFTLHTREGNTGQIDFAVIWPNKSHAVDASHCTLQMTMIEHDAILRDCVLADMGPSLKAIGIATSRVSSGKEDVMSYVEAHWYMGDRRYPVYDTRVHHVMDLIHAGIPSDNPDQHFMAEKVFLSPGRLSHLFRDEAGLTLRKYMLWCRMKYAIDLLLNRDSGLSEAALMAGFYDAAHFSKHFRDMFGVKPSAVYNDSRIVQVQVSERP